MSKRESIARYNLIIKRLRKRPSTYEEILDYLELESEVQGYDYLISKRTFHRDKNDILSLYNIEILYDTNKRVYYIEEEDSEMHDRILEAFDVFNALNLSDRLSNHIHFENRNPKGTEHLHGILQAIKQGVLIQFDYQKFYDEEPTTRITEPYALKEFKNRWYLLAEESSTDYIKIFALDRLTNLEILKKKFNYPKDFDIKEYFKNSFGIIATEGRKAQKIVLSFTPLHGKYIKTLPIHESQKIILDNEKELRIELAIAPTRDFIMEILSYGRDVQVIKPKSLIREMKEILTETLSYYSE